jgi:hypothetical protein
VVEPTTESGQFVAAVELASKVVQLRTLLM